MKTIELQFGKTSSPLSYGKLTYIRSFDNFSCEHSNSQISKRLSSDEADEIIELLKDGETVELI